MNNQKVKVYNYIMEKKLFKIEIEGTLDGDYVHVNLYDNLYEGEKRKRTSFYACV